MKKIIAISAFWILVTIFAIDTMGMQPTSNHHHRNRPRIGAPLDGGLLAVLGAAGVAYVIARKKNKNNKV